MQMRDEPAQSQALDAEVEALRRERDELRAQQRALGDVLSVINASGGNLTPVFDCILEHAHQLCGAPCGSLQLFEGNRVVPVAIRGMTPAFAAFLQDGYEISEAVRDFVKSDKARQYADLVETVKATGDAAMRVAVEAGGIHTMATVPLLQGSAVIGRIVAARQEVRPFSDHQMELLHSFASQAVIAIESARLMEAQQAALDRQTATAEILRAIANAPGNAEQSLRRIAEITERLFKASGVSLLIAQGDKFGLTFRVGAGAKQINSEIPLAHVQITPRFMPGAVYLENRQIHVPDVDDPEARARWPGITPARAAGTRTLCGTPLRREGRAIGALIVHRDRIAPFADDELELLQSFADQAAIAAENARLINETREALERQTATADVLEVIANSPAELQPVFDAIADRANRLIGGLSTAVLWVIGEQIHLAAFTSMGQALDDVLKSMYPRPVADMTGVETLRAGRTVQVTDTESDPQVPERVRKVARVRGYRSLLLTPLILDHGLIGVIFVSRAQPGVFEPRHGELLKTFADQAVIAIQNARLINETREALERQTATADVLKVIASSPSQLQPVFDAIAERSNKLIGGFSTAVLRLSGDTLHLASYTSTGEAGDAALKAMFPLPAAQLPIVGLVSDGVPAQYVDTEAASGVPERIRRLAQLRGFRSMLFAPLMSGGAPIGVISVTRREAGSYDPRHVELLRTFADQAVIAIQNVRLFDEVQAKTSDLEEALQQQTATADVLKVISRSAFDLQAVLETLVRSAVELSGAGRGSIFLRDGELFRFRAASHAADHPEWIQFLKGNPQKAGHHSAIARAISGAQTVCVPDVLADPEIRMPAQLAGIRAVLAVPLLRDGNVEGIVALSRNTPGPFDTRQIELVQTFADQAVIAIENARLFDEVQAKTRDLEEALKQQTATADVLKVISRSAFDLDTVLSTLLESASQLCGAARATLFWRDDDVMRVRASFNSRPEFLAYLAEHPIRADRRTTVGRVFQTGEIQHIVDVSADPEFDFGPAPRLGQFQTVLGVPLLREGQVEGVFALARPEPGGFDTREVELVRGFADQALIAVENTRLFEEVQERTRELSRSLDELRTAQDRLVQTEKLASLGQLTAGIAHEIKNPLNFVNNFSSLSIELIDELLDVLKAEPFADAARADVDDLTQMLKSNLDKVVQHGKRADSIVRNMLLHSREGSGEQRPADINALVEESLNLSYHGARAERPGFNITLKRDLAPDAGAAELYPQEITRVLLNLISNGFYAASKRAQEAGNGFAPELAAATRSLGDRVEIRIRDNGTGIPAGVKEKMFNPFFTTKPAGEGTGLGLSMSHDIVVKQHGGTIAVETEPNAFTEFIIVLPRATAAKS